MSNPQKLLFSAAIEWISQEQGGRKLPPSGPRYLAPARFGAWTGDGAEDAQFTLIADLVTKHGDFHWDAIVSFMVPDAPHQLLCLGALFEYYEGRRCVAKGRIKEPVD